MRQEARQLQGSKKQKRWSQMFQGSFIETKAILGISVFCSSKFIIPEKNLPTGLAGEMITLLANDEAARLILIHRNISSN